MKKLFSLKLWIVLTSVMAFLLVAAIVGSYVVNLFPSAMHMAFGTSDFATVNDPNAEVKDFYTTSYEFERNGENLYKEDSAMIEEAEAAGAVLLWNKNNTLPLKGDEGVSLMSHSAVDIIECGSGSGYSETYDYGADKAVTTTMKEAFESRGFDVNPTLWRFYEESNHKRTSPQQECKNWQIWTVDEIPWAEYTSSVINSLANYGDAAILVFSRSGGEYSDLHYNYSSDSDYTGNNDKNAGENTSANGGYLGLTDAEDELLTNVIRLKGEKVFDKVIVLINTGNPLQMQDFEPYIDGIDACMWIGQTGSTGINAVADLLKGKDMEGNDLIPSGRLTDTWAYDLNSAPSTVNDGNYIYGNSNLLTSGGTLGTTAFVSRYMVYQEGIYIGYRYYETRYADCVTGEGNANSTAGAKHSKNGWNYNEEVAFPFGYGVSYTTFAYSGFDVEEIDGGYRVTVTVKNTGNYSGREAVQVYLQKPYTDYDDEMGIEKSAIELAGYTKTGVLAPNAVETVTVDVPLDYFKTYDANPEGEMTYIIEAGDYYLTVASDAHVAINNILEKEGETPVAQAVLGGASNTKQVSFGAGFAEKFHLSRDYNTFSKSAYTGNEITNQLDSGDINLYSHRGDNSVKYLSRKDWNDTYPKEAAKLTLNAQMVNDLRFDNVPDDSGYDMPEYGVFKSGSDGIPDINNGDLVAYMFMEAPLYPELEKDNQTVYEDGLVYSKHWEKMWDQLLDQMTFQEQAFMVSNSYHQINGAVSIALPDSKQENGPVGITKRREAIFALPSNNLADEHGWTFVAYPCAGIIASSFDIDIAQRVGEHKSEDMLYLGYNGIYGPGVNMHRSPFGGRAFEYPSEDPLLAGMSAAYESLGIESKGCLAYAKHYALNDMETNRVNCGIWSNEQASREIYLRAFEIVFTVGKASATMNSFTRLGTRWCGGSYELMTSILRDEWGYDGLVISDWVTAGSAMSYVDGVLAGTDTFDGNATEDGNDLFTKYANNAAIAQAVRLACKRVIYNVVRTNVMNGTSVSTRVVRVTPWWRGALVGIQAGFGVLFGISAAMLVVSIILKKRPKKEASEA